MFRFQTHALTDYLYRGDGHTCRGIPRHAEWASLLCSLCLEFYPLDDLDEDHAPQQGGQSRFGPRHLTVLACGGCNKRAGRSYELDASRQRDTLRPPAGDFCEVHHRGANWYRRNSALLVPVDYLAFDLTDVKTAYQLGFATLGYSWILTPRLDELRAALRDRRPSADFVIADAHDGDGLEAFSVYDVTAPVPCVVVKADRVRVCLPTRCSPPNLAGEFRRLERQTGSDPFEAQRLRWSMRRYPWPEGTTAPGQTPEKSWDHSHFFALDRCESTGHEHITRTPTNEALALGA